MIIDKIDNNSRTVITSINVKPLNLVFPLILNTNNYYGAADSATVAGSVTVPGVKVNVTSPPL